MLQHPTNFAAWVVCPRENHGFWLHTSLKECVKMYDDLYYVLLLLLHPRRCGSDLAGDPAPTPTNAGTTALKLFPTSDG